MKKVGLFLVFALCGIAFALTTADVERIIKEVERELKNERGEQKYYLHIADRNRTWEGQAYEMQNMYRNFPDDARDVYGFADDLWNALVRYSNGSMSEYDFIKVLQKYRAHFKHVGGNAVDISLSRSRRVDINRTGIDKERNRDEIDEIQRALSGKGLSYIDESNIKCLHVYSKW